LGRGLAATAAVLLLGGCAGDAATGGATDGVDWSHAETLVVRLAEYRFEPAEVTLRYGQPYRLRLENTGKEMHEFTAPAFFRAARVRDASRVLAFGDDVVVQPGETRDVELVAPAPGTYKLTCADHDWAGMIGRIVVR
jgi:plastocyanin